MKVKITILSRAALAIFTLLSVAANAQLTVNGTLTPIQWVQNTLVGTGITVSNVVYTGSMTASGTFNGSASNIGFSAGVMLTSGSITNAIGPNVQTGITQANGLPGDVDLDLIMSPTLSHDASILEFDFVPVSDTVKFRYVFASDEYMEYANSGISDAFGFFISGPGITGPYSNNSKNIALIPGTTTPVTIDNVNANFNPIYYFNNEVPPGTTIEYDGFTVPLTAISAVQCGQTYHIKIAIADGSDEILDSGVFLEEGSFSSSSVQIIPQISYGGANDSTLYEGCGMACIHFVRTSNLANADTITLTITGSAVNGTDYTDGSGNPLPSVLIFAPGQDSISYCIVAVADGIPEGLDTIHFSIVSTGPCSQTTTDANLFLNEYPPLALVTTGDTTLCNLGGTVHLTALVTGGVEPYVYTWSNGAGSTPNPTVSVNVTTTFTLSVNDACNGNPDPTPLVSDTVRVNVILINDIVVNLGNDITVCPGDPVHLNSTITGGASPYVYYWSMISGTDTLLNHTDHSFIYNATGTGVYQLHIVDYCMNTSDSIVNVNVETSCVLDFPNVISPDGAGAALNDLFYINGLDKFPGSSLVIYNRWGNLLFKSSDYQNDWSSRKFPSGTYYYILSVSDGRTLPGFFQIVRK